MIDNFTHLGPVNPQLLIGPKMQGIRSRIAGLGYHDGDCSSFPQTVHRKNIVDSKSKMVLRMRYCGTTHIVSTSLSEMHVPRHPVPQMTTHVSRTAMAQIAIAQAAMAVSGFAT